jgi:hypothetical protein
MSAATTITTGKQVLNSSGVQKQIYGLYRTLLREAAKKDRGNTSAAAVAPTDFSATETITTTPTMATMMKQSLPSLWIHSETTSSYVRSEFRRQCEKVDRKDFDRIEHQIRHGYKQVKMLQMPGVKVVRKA